MMEVVNSLLEHQGRSMEMDNAKNELGLDNALFDDEKRVREMLRKHHRKVVESRALQRFWRAVEDKRDRVQQRVELHDTLVRIAFIMGLVSITTYINLAPAELDEFETSQVLMALWAGVSVVCIVLHIVVLLVSRSFPALHWPLCG
jgi:hypothetical protein